MTGRPDRPSRLRHALHTVLLVIVLPAAWWGWFQLLASAVRLAEATAQPDLPRDF